MTKQYAAFIFFSNESATILNTPAFYTTDVDTITYAQYNAITKAFLTDSVNESLTYAQLLEWWENEEFDGPDRIAFVELHNVDAISTVGDVLIKTMLDDSSCYSAANTFGKVLESLSTKVIGLDRSSDN